MSSPWQDDKWRIEERDGVKVLIWSDRVLKPAKLKNDFSWWFGSEGDQTADEAGYHPEWPEWKRQLYWNYFRNPIMNFKNYIAGVVDRNIECRSIYGNPYPGTTTRTDNAGEWGLQINCITLESGRKLYWFSYSRKWVFQIGWQPTGKFEFKFTKNGDYRSA